MGDIGGIFLWKKHFGNSELYTEFDRSTDDNRHIFIIKVQALKNHDVSHSVVTHFSQCNPPLHNAQ